MSLDRYCTIMHPLVSCNALLACVFFLCFFFYYVVFFMFFYYVPFVFLEDSLSSLGGKDVDHRNLISLTGSPNVEGPLNGGHQPKPLPVRGNLKTITPQESLWETLDQVNFVH